MIANLTPWSLDTLLGDDSPIRLRREAAQRESGWGAFVLYLGVKSNALPRELPDHHQIVTEMRGPLGEGRSIFVSLSPAWDTTRAPDGYRAATVTTHTAIQPWWDLLSSKRDVRLSSEHVDHKWATFLEASTIISQSLFQILLDTTNRFKDPN